MLTLSRKQGEAIAIGDKIVVTVLRIRSGGQVQLGLEAPREIPIRRGEEQQPSVDCYTDLGWANGWEQTPELVIECSRKKHPVTSKDIGPPFRGMHNVVTCTICRYVYYTDSSD